MSRPRNKAKRKKKKQKRDPIKLRSYRKKYEKKNPDRHKKQRASTSVKNWQKKNKKKVRGYRKKYEKKNRGKLSKRRKAQIRKANRRYREKRKKSNIYAPRPKRKSASKYYKPEQNDVSLSIKLPNRINDKLIKRTHKDKRGVCTVIKKALEKYLK